MIFVTPISRELMKSYANRLTFARAQLHFKIDLTIYRIPGYRIRSAADFSNGRRLRLSPLDQKTLWLLGTILKSQLSGIHLNFHFARRQFPLTATSSHYVAKATPGQAAFQSIQPVDKIHQTPAMITAIIVMNYYYNRFT
jgi:hypothetical protein